MDRFSLFLVLTLGCAFVTFAAMADEQGGVAIESNEASYDGKQMRLTGDVVVEHEIGKISAGFLELMAQPGQKKLSLGELKMDGLVKVALKDGGQLLCDSALLNSNSLQGFFYSGPQQEFVVFTESCRDRSNSQIPLVVKSKIMTVLLTQEEGKATARTSYISSITADVQTSVTYNHDFVVSADRGIYRRLNQAQEASSPIALPGTILLQKEGESGVCQVTNRNGDLVKAQQICVNTVRKELVLDFPRGMIYGDKQQRLDFSADQLVWNAEKMVLTLNGHAVIHQPGMGQLETDKQVAIQQWIQEGKKTLKSMESLGTTILTYDDTAQEQSHVLTCCGTVVVDHAIQETRMESTEGEQIVFRDSLGEIHADRAKVSYQAVDNQWVPSKLVLEGQVRIENWQSNNENEKQILHYVLADSVEFRPDLKEMYLNSIDKRRVLFYDKVNNAQVSAPALTIKRNEVTKKEAIQGTGDVRFSFVDQEFEELRQRFSLKKEEAANE